jgi:hypothetical protein
MRISSSASGPLTRFAPLSSPPRPAAQDCYSHGVHARGISRARAGLNSALVVGTYASFGFLRTEAAWRGFLGLLVLLAVLLGGNAAVLQWRATVARHKRRKAEAELLGKRD